MPYFVIKLLISLVPCNSTYIGRVKIKQRVFFFSYNVLIKIKGSSYCAFLDKHCISKHRGIQIQVYYEESSVSIFFFFLPIKRSFFKAFLPLCYFLILKYTKCYALKHPIIMNHCSLCHRNIFLWHPEDM